MTRRSGRVSDGRHTALQSSSLAPGTGAAALMENPMFRIPLSLLVLSVALTSCSKSSTAPSGGTTDSRGTPITGDNAFDTSTRLAWSPATNEVLGDAKSGGTLGAAGLAAVRTVDGATRFLTNNPVLFPTLTSDGTQVYADEITADSTLLRRRSLGAATMTRIAAVPGLDAFTFVVSTDGRYIAYAAASISEPLEPDTIHVLDTVAGTQKAFAPGTPIVFSFDDGTLLITGYALYAGIYALLALHATRAGVVVAFVLLGVQTAMIDGQARALVARLVSAAARATAYGVHATVVGLALLPASLVAGWLWDHVGPAATFGAGAVLALLAALLLPLLLPAHVDAGA